MFLMVKTLVLNRFEMKFEEVEWHDAIIKEIKIDRRNPGYKDIIEIELSVHDTKVQLLFEEVYLANMQMNFNVIAEETLLEAYIDDDDKELESLRTKWKDAGLIVDLLRCYVFNTNSTNSILKIYALTCRIT